MGTNVFERNTRFEATGDNGAAGLVSKGAYDFTAKWLAARLLSSAAQMGCMIGAGA